MRHKAIAGLLLASALWILPAAATAQPKTVTADVAILDHVLVFNRLGAQNVNGMIFALERDLVDAGTLVPCGANCVAGNTILRPDKRPRPLVLRVSAGDSLVVHFRNLLTPAANPFPPLPDEANPCAGCDAANPLAVLDDQVADRHASFYVQGLELLPGSDNPVYAGNQAVNPLPAPGQTATYRYRAAKEGTLLVTSMGVTFGGEATGGNASNGPIGAVNVEPLAARYYRSQVTDEELRLALDTASPNSCAGTPGYTCDGHPILDYEATYPAVAPWTLEGKAGLPVLNMLDAGNNVVHADLNAVITGPTAGNFPPNTYPLESQGKRNPTVPNRLEPFREFTTVFHDEVAAANAFPAWYRADINPVIAHTTHSVRDSFMINYGSGGIGSEIIANRLGVGPMWDCLDCAYEEFFLSAFTVGDPAMLVDVPANTGLENCGPDLNPADCAAVGPKATVAFYPDDPSNVHHSYTGDFVKFRNLHAGPKEQHIFHLHNHQWLFNSNDDNSNYLDAQAIGPGSGYTYEINFGGSGNRNKTAGDAIFHCHFYPHFAQGMWELWRVHDTLESGTALAVSGGGFHTAPFALKNGTPAAGARALPDGEILAGTPIPAVVPLPGKPMAPVPAQVSIVAKNANPGVDDDPLTPGVQELAESSQIAVARQDVNGDGILDNPGYPFWIAGVDCGGAAGLADPTGCRDGIVGQRPSTPPLDMMTVSDAIALKQVQHNPLFQHPGFVAAAGGFNGGLPRHSLEGFTAVEAAPGTARGDVNIVEQTQTRFDFRKVIHKAKPVYFPEEGTEVEQAVMATHAVRFHDTFRPDGSAASGTAGFVLNGAPPVPGAPYNEPCIDDQGDLFIGSGEFFGATAGSFFTASPGFDATDPRVYKAANIQLDVVFNKVGYHFPQQRIISLFGDVMPLFNKQKPPEPFVIRMNTFDCTEYHHSNLVPSEYELDDYQVRTPTDILGQHIHLPKWDLVSADGSGNGWNYEDGTLSPAMVQERIEAINHFNDDPLFADVPTIPLPDGSGGGLTHLTPGVSPDPDFPTAHPMALGARTTLQRWFADPVVNTDLEDRGLGIIFTHDHFGPSTHQQVGLYATVLTEPAGSIWRHNETGVQLATRTDGGPTSWQAIIEPATAGAPGQPASAEPFREFYFEFADFQHAYEAVAAGIMPDAIPDPQMFRNAIDPSVREAAPFPDIFRFSPQCPGGVPRPCPEAISAQDVGMWVANYRNEPVGLRVFDPAAIGPDGNAGSQTAGVAGDLSFALATHFADKAGNVVPITRAVPQMNLDPQTADLQFWTQTLNAGGGLPGDPFTPMLRTYPGDLIRVKIQTGATEEEHNATIHGVKWLQAGSGHGAAPNSGWRNAQEAGISEQFTFSAPVNADPQRIKGPSDYAYSVDASQDGWWSGMWGVLRNYDEPQPDLQPLAGGFTQVPNVVNRRDFAGVCPAANPGAPPGQLVPANLRRYTVIAITANQLLDNPLGATLVPGDLSATMHVGAPVDPNGGTLVYNPRTTQAAFQGPLHDPTAVLFVNAADLEPLNGFLPNGRPVDAACRDSGGQNPTPGVANPACPVKLKAGLKPEPLVLRAAAGDCIEATLFNRLPDVLPDLAGFTTLLGLVNRDRNDVAGGVTTFNNNLIRPSSRVGLHPQLVEYDVTQHDGACVGVNVCGDGTNTVGPVQPDGKLDKAVTYRWYAGHLDYVREATGVRIVANPVEFGGANLRPSDVVKQGQKALIGALVVEPQGSAWSTDAGQRAAASVGPDANGDGSPDSLAFRDFAVVFQKSLNLRYGDGTPVENIGGEEGESEDTGQDGLNYGIEPAWFRFGLPANVPFGHGPGQLGAVANAHELYSNNLAGGDPATPVFTALAGAQARMRVLNPTGATRGSTFDLQGHQWQRDPYLAGAVPSQTIGINPLAMYLGGQESVLPAAHFEIFLPSAGGASAVTGDYLFRDHASFGNTNGLWGILRVVNTIP